MSRNSPSPASKKILVRKDLSPRLLPPVDKTSVSTGLEIEGFDVRISPPIEKDCSPLPLMINVRDHIKDNLSIRSPMALEPISQTDVKRRVSESLTKRSNSIALESTPKRKSSDPGSSASSIMSSTTSTIASPTTTSASALKTISPPTTKKIPALKNKKKLLNEKTNKEKEKESESELLSEEEERKNMARAEFDLLRLDWWGKENERKSNGLKIVYIFISSTFNDFHGERDLLTRTIFPELNFLLRDRKIVVVPVDLRWGLTSQDTSDTGLGALEHCLIEAERAKPFFLCLLGERYGWIPPFYRLSENKAYDWVKKWESGHSITAMEMFHGFLRRPYNPSYAFAYQRDSSFLSDISSEKERRIFIDCAAGSVEERKRNQLRESVKNHQHCLYREYTCSYGGMDRDGKAMVTNLKSFQSLVLSDLLAAIEKEFPLAEFKKATPLDIERGYHLDFINYRSRQFIGRKELMLEVGDIVNKSIKNTSASSSASSKVDNSNLPLVIVGSPGSGKTSFVTSFTKRFQVSNPSIFVLVHVVSSSPSSTDIRLSLLRFVEEIDLAFHFNNNPKNKEYRNIKSAFWKSLKDAGNSVIEKKSPFTHVLLVIDAVNQLHKTYHSHSMDWLPNILPKGVSVIISATPDDDKIKIVSTLSSRTIQPNIINIPGLSRKEQESIIQLVLSEHRKKLTDSQMDIFLSKKVDSMKPLYLLIACEELRLHGMYGIGGEEIDKKMLSFPEKIPDLFESVLLRVENDMESWAMDLKKSYEKNRDVESLPSTPVAPKRKIDYKLYGKDLVVKALTLLECSRHGLLETELLELLALHDEIQLPIAVWSRLYRSLSAYFRPQSEDSEGTLDFFHDQLSFAVSKRYDLALNSKLIFNDLVNYYTKKADPDGNLTWRGDHLRSFIDLTYYQICSLNVTGLFNTLGNLYFISARCSFGDESITELIREFQDVRDFLENVKFSKLKTVLDKDMTRNTLLNWLREFEIFVKSHHNRIFANPDINTIFQLAINQPDNSAPYQVALKMLSNSEEDGTKPIHPFSAFLNKNSFSSSISSTSSTSSSMSSSVNQIKFNASYMKWLNKPQKNSIVAEFSASQCGIQACALSNDGASLILGGADSTVRMIHSQSGELIREMSGGHVGSVTCLNFNSTHTRAVSGGDDALVILWDVLSGAKLSYSDAHVGMITCASLIPFASGVGSIVLSASVDHTIRLWETGIDGDRFIEIWRTHWMPAPVLNVSYSHVDSLIYTARSDGFVQIWDAHALNLGLIDIHTAKLFDKQLVAVSVSTDCFFLACGGDDGLIKLYTRLSKETGFPRHLGNLHGHLAEIICINWCKLDHRLVSSAQDRKILVFDADTMSTLTELSGHVDDICFVSFVPDSLDVVSASMDDTVKRWSLSNLKIANSNKNSKSPPTSIGRKSITDSFRTSMFMGNHIQDVTTIAASPDCERFVTGSLDCLIKVWSTETLLEIITLNLHKAAIVCVSWTDHGRYIISSDTDGFVILWDSSTYAYCHTMENYSSVEYTTGVLVRGVTTVVTNSKFNNLPSPDAPGRKSKGVKFGQNLSFSRMKCGISHSVGELFVAGCEDGSLRVWNIKHNSVVSHSVFGGTNYAEITTVTFNLEGDILATGDLKGRIKIWKVSPSFPDGCELIDTMADGTHTGAILALGYSPDGLSFYSISADLTMKYWDIENSKMFSNRYFSSLGIFAISANFNTDRSLGLIGADDQSLRVITTGPKNAGTELYKFFTYGNITSITSFKRNSKEQDDILAGDSTGRFYVLIVK